MSGQIQFVDMTWRLAPRPIHALLKQVSAAPDSQAALASVLAELTPEEEAALLPEIEAEKKRRDDWFAREGRGT